MGLISRVSSRTYRLELIFKSSKWLTNSDSWKTLCCLVSPPVSQKPLPPQSSESSFWSKTRMRCSKQVDSTSHTPASSIAPNESFKAKESVHSGEDSLSRALVSSSTEDSTSDS